MSKTTIQRGVRITLILGVVLFIAFAAFFSKTIGITFATGGLQLQIDSHTVYNGEVQPSMTWALKDLVPGVDKFFNFDDVKPGDEGQTIISLHTDKNAWACMDFTNLVDTDNGNNEPESLDDLDGALGGELSKGAEFFAWVDDGDNTYEVGEKPIFGTSSPQAGLDVLKKYILADSSTGSYFPANVTKYVGIHWCAGDLEVNTATAVISCDGSVLGNGAQTDSFSVDLALRTVTADDSPYFRCDGTVDIPGLELFMEKKFSGPQEGFTPEQFSFHIVGEGIDAIVPHGGSIKLPVGTYSIEEVVPAGFNIPDWRIQWSGDTCEGENVAGGLASIEVEERDLRKVVSYCRADNQYRPVEQAISAKSTTNTAVPSSQSNVQTSQSSQTVSTQTVQTTQTTQTTQTVQIPQATSPLSRAAQTVRNLLRR